MYTGARPETAFGLAAKYTGAVPAARKPVQLSFSAARSSGVCSCWVTGPEHRRGATRVQQQACLVCLENAL